MGFGKVKLPAKWQEKPLLKQPVQMFRLNFKPPEWKSPVLREIASAVNKYLKPERSLGYHARSLN
jgi:hypothetical protein